MTGAGAIRAVILAAGTSSRVGRQKLLLPFRCRPLIEYSIAAAQAWNPLVVAGSEVAAYLAGRKDVTLVRNDAPDKGMTHSLLLADAALGAEETMLVLLGDKPLVSAALAAAICVADSDADVVYPLRGKVPGHPVRLSPRARRCARELPAGDTLRLLRARTELASIGLQTADEGAFFDVDTLETFG